MQRVDSQFILAGRRYSIACPFRSPLAIRRIEDLRSHLFSGASDPSGQFLYVLSDQTCTSASVDPVNCPQGTAIHILQINSDGTLTDTPASPLIISPFLVPGHAKEMVVPISRCENPDLMQGWGSRIGFQICSRLKN